MTETETPTYQTDGRAFEIRTRRGHLELASRPAFPWNWLPTAFITVFVAPIFLIPTGIWQVIAFLVVVCCGFFLNRFVPQFSSSHFLWIFDWETNALFADKDQIATLDQIVAVRAQKRDFSRLTLVLDLRSERELAIGGACFSRQEWAWRRAAQTLADFLGVPLETSPV